MAKPKPETPSFRSLAQKAEHASRTPEEKAKWRQNISEGMVAWNASRTPEQKELTRQKQSAAAICNSFTRAHGPTPASWKKGQRPVGNLTEEALARARLTRVQTASVKRILKEVVAEDPERVRDAIIRGIESPNPAQAFLFVSLAAKYLDIPPSPNSVESPEDLSHLTPEQLLERVLALANRLKSGEQPQLGAGASLPVIDVVPEREPTLAELNEQIRQAEEELRVAQEELRRLTGGRDGAR